MEIVFTVTGPIGAFVVVTARYAFNSSSKLTVAAFPDMLVPFV